MYKNNNKVLISYESYNIMPQYNIKNNKINTTILKKPILLHEYNFFLNTKKYKR